MDWMYANCSTTAQRGALDWKGRFREAVAPVFESLYEKVKSGEETAHRAGGQLRARLPREARRGTEGDARFRDVATGAAVRSLRPENWKK